MVWDVIVMWQCVGGVWYWVGDNSDVICERFVVAVV